MKISDEGTSQGTGVFNLNCVGGGVSCTKSGTIGTVTVSAGITDHGDLSGLADEDHSAYIEKDGGSTTTALIHFAQDSRDVFCHYLGTNSQAKFCYNSSVGTVTLHIGEVLRETWGSSVGDTRVTTDGDIRVTTDGDIRVMAIL